MVALMAQVVMRMIGHMLVMAGREVRQSRMFRHLRQGFGYNTRQQRTNNHASNTGNNACKLRREEAVFRPEYRDGQPYRQAAGNRCQRSLGGGALPEQPCHQGNKVMTSVIWRSFSTILKMPDLEFIA